MVDTHAETSCGDMLSRSTTSAPASTACFTWSWVSHSTSTVRPGQCSRARSTASSMVMPVRWLSFTITKSDRLPRWLAPPPARTAAFSSARNPGVVLRVSQMRAFPWVARTQCRVVDATPERCCRKFSAVRSAVSIDASGPSTCARVWPGPTSWPSSACQRTSSAGSTWWNTSVAAAQPARTPSSRATMAPVARWCTGMSDAVRSPSAPMSSASARATASRTAARGG